MSDKNEIEVREDIFGYLPDPSSKNDVPIRRYTLSNKNGMQVSVISYGAAITSLRVPDGEGNYRDVILGFDDITGYLKNYAGGYNGVAGRVASFIENGKFTLNGEEYQLGVNHREHHLHGGAKGFHTKIWEANVDASKRVMFSCVSEDGEEGYPSTVLVQVTYELKSDNQLLLNFEAMPSKPTPINLTMHGHFNLGGHETAHLRLVDHQIEINADTYTAPGPKGIPNGEIKNVNGTNLDFRVPKKLNALLEEFPPGPNGYNVNYCVNPSSSDSELHFVSRIKQDKTRIMLEVFSNQPGVQFYTGQHWPDPAKNDEAIIGKGGAKYMKFGFIALETQQYPNAVNVESFPNIIVNPGEMYQHTLLLKFGIV